MITKLCSRRLKIAICIITLFIGQIARAQYFGHTYAGGMIGNGHVTKLNAPGHIMSQYVPGSQGFGIVRTDINGNIMNPRHHSSLNWTFHGGPIKVNSTYICEGRQGNVVDGFHAIFGYTADSINGWPGDSGLMYVRFDTSAQYVHYMGYNLNYGVGNWRHPVTTAVDITQCKNCGWPGGTEDYFVAGNILDGEDTYLLVLRIHPNGNPYWGNVYKIDAAPINSYTRATRIIQSPYNQNELFVIGSIYLQGQQDEDGFILTLDGGNGKIVSANRYDADNNYNSFNGIALSEDPNNDGYILCGYDQSLRSTTGYALVTKMDRNMNIQWSNFYIENHDQFQNMWANDVVGRKNTLGDYEYYVAGCSQANGSQSGLSLKLDANGIAVPLGLKLYGVPSHNNIAMSVDVNTSGVGDGVSYYMQDIGMSQQGYILKSYFNGVSGCNDDFYEPVTFAAEVRMSPLQAQIVGNYSPFTLQIIGTGGSSDFTNCYNSTVPGGSNARPENTSASSLNDNVNQLNVYPNPATDGITVNTQQAINKISIKDITGKTVWERSNIEDVDGNYTIDIQSLQSGIYFITLTDDKNFVKSSKFVKVK